MEHRPDTFRFGDRAGRPLAPSFERRRLQLSVLMILVDSLAIVGCFFLAKIVLAGGMPTLVAPAEAGLLLPPYLIVGAYQGVYSIDALGSWRIAISRLAITMALAVVLVLLVTFYASNMHIVSRGIFTLGICFSFVALIALRFGQRRLTERSWGPNILNRLIIQDGGPRLPANNAFVVDAESHHLFPDHTNPEMLDRLGRYFKNMDQVIVSCPVERRGHWSFVMRAAGIRGEVVSEVLEELGALGLQRHDGFTSLIISSGPLGLRARLMKRGLDLILTVPAIIVLSPLMLAVAAAIKMEDGGPVFFKQRRLGLGNRFFEVYKFRSMSVAGSDKDGTRSASKTDDRITRVGRIIRATSLDEIPQLLNVVFGDMSLVGPRPHAVGSLAGHKLFWEVDHRYWHRHALKPGMTGLAQIRGFRGATDREEDLSDRLQADLEYIRDWTPLRDLGIIIATVRVVVHDRAF